MRIRVLVFSFIGIVLAGRAFGGPMLAVNHRTFSEVNVNVVGAEVRAAGSTEFVAVRLAGLGTTTVNLLALANDQDWLNVLPLPTGTYDAFRLTVESSTANLIDAGTLAVAPLLIGDPDGKITFVFMAPLRVGTTPHVVFTSWLSDASVRVRGSTSEYVLASVLTAIPVNWPRPPIPIRSLSGRLASIDAATGDLRMAFQSLSAALFLVRTSALTTIRDGRGRPLPLTALRPGDTIVVSGALDANTDLDARRLIRR